MSTTLQRLATWARDLQPGDLPVGIAERVRLQHLGIAGAVRAVAAWPLGSSLRSVGGRRGAAALVGGGRATRRDAVRAHAALAALLAHDDWLLSAHCGASAAPVAWAHARGQAVEDLVTATAAANEVAGRLGAAALLGPGGARGQLVTTSLAAAVVAGRLAGLDASSLAHAFALACLAPAQLGPRDLLAGDGSAALAHAAAAVRGLEAVELAQAGVRGPLDLLDARGGLLDQLTPAPLRAAFTGLGRAWLGQSLAFSIHPVAPALQVPVQAVEEILSRHVKAADKRLRWDQVDRIEVELGAPGWRLCQQGGVHASSAAASWCRRLPEAVGLLVATHTLGPAALDPAAVESHREAVAAVARRVEVRHSWTRTADLVEHLVEVAGPLLAGLTAGELRAAGRAHREASGGASLPPPLPAELVAAARLRPGRLAERLRYQSGDLADARLDELQLRLGADVRLYTTRGGSWPERRDLPIGSPGWPWEDTVARVCGKWGEDAAQARQLLAGAGDAEAWVDALIGA